MASSNVTNYICGEASVSLVWWKPTFQLLFVSFITKPLKLTRTIKELSWGSP